MNVAGHWTFSGNVVVVAVSSDRVDVPLRRGMVGFGRRERLGENKTITIKIVRSVEAKRR